MNYIIRVNGIITHRSSRHYGSRRPPSAAETTSTTITPERNDNYYCYCNTRHWCVVILIRGTGRRVINLFHDPPIMTGAFDLLSDTSRCVRDVASACGAYHVLLGVRQ